MMGIYSIVNKVNGKRYVGQSIYLDSRLNYHFTNLRKGTHFIPHLQSSYNLYGEDNFYYEILETVDNRELLNEREIYWIDYYGTLDPSKGYNRARGGGAVSWHVSSETRHKISVGISRAKRGKPGHPQPDSFKLRMSKIMKGRTFSEETRRRMSNSARGKVLSDNTKRKLSKASSGCNNPMYGKHLSDEAKLKISITHKGRRRSIESRCKQSICNKGVNNPRYGVRGELHPNYGKISVTKDGYSEYINPKDLEYYEHLGYSRGRPHNDNISKARSKYIYTYDGKDFYGWIKLASYICDATGDWICQTILDRLSQGLPTKKYQEYSGLITRRLKDESC